MGVFAHQDGGGAVTGCVRYQLGRERIHRCEYLRVLIHLCTKAKESGGEQGLGQSCSHSTSAPKLKSGVGAGSGPVVFSFHQCAKAKEWECSRIAHLPPVLLSEAHRAAILERAFVLHHATLINESHGRVARAEVGPIAGLVTQAPNEDTRVVLITVDEGSNPLHVSPFPRGRMSKAAMAPALVEQVDVGRRGGGRGAKGDTGGKAAVAPWSSRSTYP